MSAQKNAYGSNPAELLFSGDYHVFNSDTI